MEKTKSQLLVEVALLKVLAYLNDVPEELTQYIQRLEMRVERLPEDK